MCPPKTCGLEDCGQGYSTITTRSYHRLNRCIILKKKKNYLFLVTKDGMSKIKVGLLYL